jgi:hypothetical protein
VNRPHPTQHLETKQRKGEPDMTSNSRGTSATAQTEKAAKACGMDTEEFVTVQQRVRIEKARGRRPAGTAGADTKLANWGEVEGQADLFADSE